MSVPRFALPTLVSAILLGGVAFHGAVEAAAPGFIPAKPIYATSGVALVVFEGGSLDDLEAATRAAGSIGAWVQDDRGEFHVLPVGAPAFLKKRLDAAFPARVGNRNFTQQRAMTLVAPD